MKNLKWVLGAFLMGCSAPQVRPIGPQPQQYVPEVTQEESQSFTFLHGVKPKRVDKKEFAETVYQIGKDVGRSELALENLSLRFQVINLRNELEKCQKKLDSCCD